MSNESSPLALIIEDEHDVTVIFEQALQAAGYETEVIESGADALERLAVTTPDIVVLDIYLPGVAGTDILDRIHEDPRLAETRVIVATADPVMAESITIREAADLVLVKPISYIQLRDLSSRLKGKGEKQ